MALVSLDTGTSVSEAGGASIMGMGAEVGAGAPELDGASVITGRLDATEASSSPASITIFTQIRHTNSAVLFSLLSKLR